MSNQDIRNRLVELDRAIEQQQASLNSLLKDREIIRGQLDSIQYPVSTLPVDVALEIFSHCYSSVENCNYHHGNRYWSPTALVGICRLWREIALATPVLWTPILRLKANEWLPLRRLERYFDRRLSLAQGRPFPVSLEGSFVRSAGEAAFVAFMHRLALRLESLKLEVAVTDLVALDRSRPSFPFLQNLSISFQQDRYGHDQWAGVRRMEFVFTNTPQLRDLHVNRAARGTIDFPHTQLTKYRGTLRDDEAWRILASATGLVECALSLFGNVDRSLHDLGLGSLCLLHLQSLDLPGGHMRPTEQDLTLISLLTLPALRNLTVAEIQENHAAHFITFLSRHSAQLRTLSFCDSPCTTTLVSIESLRSMRELTDLVLSDLDLPFIYDFFREIEDPQKQFLPRIQRISFVRSRVSIPSADMEIIARGLSSRVAQIRSFRLEYCCSGEEMIEEIEEIHPHLHALLALVARGMAIHMGTKSTTNLNYIGMYRTLPVNYG
ncbi:hypothetical protein DFH09DRAFT_92964 [Mycena vulgaris]|nr:hypothetical protein DFH09DRAFT_92964 [Mycena vulgaris]